MSLFDKILTANIFQGAAGKEEVVHSIKPQESLASNATDLIINGDFTEPAGGTGGLLQHNVYDADVGWNLASPASTGQESKITGDGLLTIKTTSLPNALAYAHNGTNRDILTEDASYKLVYTIKEITAGANLRGYWSAGYKSIPATVGTHAVTMVHTTGSTNKLFLFSLNSSNSFVSITDVSIHKLGQRNHDFGFFRGSDTSATRINKDGLVEKAREQLCYNTVFAGAGTDTDPTGWQTSNQDGGGTFAPLASDSKKIKVEITDASNTSDRWFLVFSQSGSGAYTTSIYVDEVTGTAPAINQVLTSVATSGAKTEITYWKDGEKIAKTTAVEAGHRYGYTAYHSGNSVHRWGLGVSSDITATCSVTISKPQIEEGLYPTEYIENTQTQASLVSGVQANEPRFNYEGGGCPSLLMEPQRVNKVTASEYFEHSDWQIINSSNGSLDFGYEAPDGTKSAYKASNTATGGSSFALYTTGDGTIVAGTTRSIWAKTVSGTGTVDLLTFNANTDNLFTITNEWQRFELTGSDHVDGKPNLYAVDFRGGGTLSEVLIWGAQAETGSWASSYIPTNSSIGTRARDGDNSATDVMIPKESYDLSGSWSLMLDLGYVKHTKGTTPTAIVILYLLTNSSTENVGFFHNPSASDAGINPYFFGNGNYLFGTGANDAADGDSKICVSYDKYHERLTYYINGDLIGYTKRSMSFGDNQRGYFIGGNATGDGDDLGFELNQYLFFNEGLSDTETAILTGTSYNSFGAMVDALTNYTTYE